MLDYDTKKALIDRVITAEKTKSTEIHEQDNMRVKDEEFAYLCIGSNALHLIVDSMIISGVASVSDILDFPSGWGRVTRYLRAAWPDANITVGDIWKESVDWTSEKFNATALYSQKDISKVTFNQYDLCWCGSLITHLPEDSATVLLDTLISNIKVGGLLILTTHGRKEVENQKINYSKDVFRNEGELNGIVEKFENGNYAYSDYFEQSDYGMSFIPFNWYWNYISKKDNITMTCYGEKLWNNHQDAIVIYKYT